MEFGKQLGNRIRSDISEYCNGCENRKRPVLIIGNKKHYSANADDDDCRGQIGAHRHESRKKSDTEGTKPGVQLLHFFIVGRDQRRQENDNACLHKLRGLHTHAENTNPALRTVGAETDKAGGDDRDPAQDINAQTGLPESMIVHLGNQQHEYYAAPCKNHLPMQIVLGIVQLVLGRIAGGRIHHQHAEARDEQHRKQEAVVIKPLSFFLFFHLTSLICLTPQCLHSASALTQSLKILPRTS